MKLYLKFTVILLALLLSSCAAENYNLSPLSNSLSSENNNNLVASEFSIEKNINASEISQLVSSFPNFKNEAVDIQVANLKVHLTDYLQALKANNISGKERSLVNIETSYKKIQKLRKFLDSDYNETLNRYLVRIKTNISEIETISKQDLPK